MLHAKMAASSSKAWLLKRPSQNRPVTRSSRLARRAIGSQSDRIHQEMLDSLQSKTPSLCASQAGNAGENEDLQ